MGQSKESGPNDLATSFLPLKIGIRKVLGKKKNSQIFWSNQISMRNKNNTEKKF